MPTWTVHLVSSSGLVALVGRLQVSGSVVEAFLIGAAVCSLGLFGLYGRTVLRTAASRFHALRISHPATSGSEALIPEPLLPA